MKLCKSVMSNNFNMRVLYILLVTFLISACKFDFDQANAAISVNNHPVTVEAEACSTFGVNDFVYNEMRDNYLWYETIPVIDPHQYESAQSVLDAIRYQALDRFSFIISSEAFNNLINTGEFFGVGIAFSNTSGYILYVNDSSPAHQAGIQRGDKILTVNSIDIDDIIAQNLWDDVFGANEAGVQVSITIEKVNSSLIENHNLQKESVTQNSVVHRSVISHNGNNIGYMVYNGFTNYSLSELADAFQFFNNQNLDDFILDLRYNGGGLLTVANYLASSIAGPGLDDKRFYTVNHNNKNQNSNFSRNFTNENNALQMTKLTVLTSGSTCSASELIINGLQPFIDVKVVGDTTCGKPLGSYNPQHCDIILSHIAFNLINHDGDGDYLDGITPDCIAVDDALHDFADTNEALLNEALYLYDTGTCSPTALSKSAEPKRDKIKDKNIDYRAILFGENQNRR